MTVARGLRGARGPHPAGPQLKGGSGQAANGACGVAQQGMQSECVPGRGAEEGAWAGSEKSWV